MATINGIEKLLGALRKMERDTVGVVGRALYEEALDVAQKADLLVPYDSGMLARSQVVHHPNQAGNKVFVDITYGGVATPYAQVQHENLTFMHPSRASGLPPNGRQAKYLEQPAREALIGLQYRLGIRIEAIARGFI